LASRASCFRLSRRRRRRPSRRARRGRLHLVVAGLEDRDAAAVAYTPGQLLNAGRRVAVAPVFTAANTRTQMPLVRITSGSLTSSFVEEVWLLGAAAVSTETSCGNEQGLTLSEPESAEYGGIGCGRRIARGVGNILPTQISPWPFSPPRNDARLKYMAVQGTRKHAAKPATAGPYAPSDSRQRPAPSSRG
jgi:hypothetical protein